VRVRFQADADLNEDIIAATLRLRPEVEFGRAIDGGLSGLPDAEVLARASSLGAVLVTHDAATMPTHFGAFVEHTSSSGVLVVPQRYAVGAIARELVLIWEASAAEDWRNVLVYLPL
jgi:hypothetical protein